MKTDMINPYISNYMKIQYSNFDIKTIRERKVEKNGKTRNNFRQNKYNDLFYLGNKIDIYT